MRSFTHARGTRQRSIASLAALAARAGTAKLVLNLPGPGSISVGGQGVEPLDAQASAAGNFPVRIRATGAAASQLESTGSVRVSVVVSFIPTGGDESAKTKRITLLLKS